MRSHLPYDNLVGIGESVLYLPGLEKRVGSWA